MAEPGAPLDGTGTDARRARLEGTHLLVRAGEYSCALPLAAVRRVVRALTVHPLPGAAGELEGLAEFGGEPLPVLNLARLVNASPGANPSYPVTVVVWVGPVEGREMIGFTADAALEVVHVPSESVVAGDGGFLLGEAPVGGEVVRILNLDALGR